MDPVRDQFESFEATGELFGSHYHRSVSPDEVGSHREEFEEALANLKQLDESDLDQARPYPGEVNSNDLQGRFWQTPCGWQLSTWGGRFRTYSGSFQWPSALGRSR